MKTRKAYPLVTLLLAITLSALINSRGASAQEYVDLVQKALADSNFTWRSSTASGVQIFYQPDSFAEQHRAMLGRSVSTALAEVLDFLEEPTYERTLRVFYLNSREEMERIVGSPVSGFATWSASAIFIVLNPDWRSFEKHEITHVLTMHLWGPPDTSSHWMIEGIAICADGWCRQYQVDEIANHLLATDQLPPLPKLFEAFRELGEIRAGMYTGSVIGFLHRTYGAEALRDIWQNGSGDPALWLGSDWDQVGDAWQQYLQNAVDANTQVDLETIDELGCG